MDEAAAHYLLIFIILVMYCSNTTFTLLLAWNMVLMHPVMVIKKLPAKANDHPEEW